MEKDNKKEKKDEASSSDAEFIDSIRSMLNDFPNQKNWDGITELTPVEETESAEPTESNVPGSVGFAPQGKIGQLK